MTPAAGNARGVILMLLAMAAYAVGDAFIKGASGSLPPGQIMLALGLFGAALFAALARRRGHPPLSGLAVRGAVLGRNLSEMAGTLCFVAALATAPLVTATAILQALPLVVALGAALILREPVGVGRWAAIVGGFAGVLMVVRPWDASFEPASLLAVGAVVALAARDLFTRRVPPGVSTLLLAAWGSMAVALVGALLLGATGGAAWPTAGGAALLAGAVTAGTAGYWWLTESTRVAELSAVMPFRYARLLFAIVIGVAAFDERPDGWTLAGAAVIVGAGVWAGLRERAREALSRGAATG